MPSTKCNCELLDLAVRRRDSKARRVGTAHRLAAGKIPSVGTARRRTEVEQVEIAVLGGQCQPYYCGNAKFFGKKIALRGLFS